MHLMNKHVGDFTVFYHTYSQNDKSDEHCWEHCGIALIERVFADQVKQDAHWYQVFQIQLKHSPPLRPVVV